jgi:hypothetical protein
MSIFSLMGVRNVNAFCNREYIAPLIRSMQYVNDFNIDMFFCNSIVLFNLYLSNLIN